MKKTQTNRRRNPRPNTIDQEFEEMYAAMDIRPGIRNHAKEIARALFKQGFNYGVSCERAKG